MPSLFRVLCLCLLALGQLWGMAVLLLARQTEALLLCLLAAEVFWLWWGWASFLRKRRVECVLAGLCLLLNLTVGLLCLWDLLDVSHIPLL